MVRSNVPEATSETETQPANKGRKARRSTVTASSSKVERSSSTPASAKGGDDEDMDVDDHEQEPPTTPEQRPEDNQRTPRAPRTARLHKKDDQKEATVLLVEPPQVKGAPVRFSEAYSRLTL